MKKIFKLLLVILIIFGCYSLLNKTNEKDSNNSSINSSTNTSEVTYLDLKGTLFYQQDLNNSNSFRFIMMFGGLNEELYNGIHYVKFEIYNNTSNELLTSSIVENRYLSLIVTHDDETETIVHASDYGYDYLYAYSSLLVLDNEYKILVNFYNDNGIFYRFTRIIEV